MDSAIQPPACRPPRLPHPVPFRHWAKKISRSMTGTLDVLPDACVHEILQRTDAVAILRFQATCKRYLSLGRAASLWKNKLEQLCGFKLPHPLSNNSPALMRIARAVYEGSDDPIAFSGVSTDGGMYSLGYWLDNMFREGPYGYCTREDADRGVFCIATREPDEHQPKDVQGTQNGANRVITVQGEPSITCNNVAVGALADRTNEDALVVVRRVFVSRSGHYSCPVASGAVSLGHVNWKSLMAQQPSPIEAAAQLHREVARGKENKLGALNSMESVLRACKYGMLQPMTVSWGGNGEWVEFCGQGDSVLQPVVWFHFFDDEEYSVRKSDCERERRRQLACGEQVQPLKLAS